MSDAVITEREQLPLSKAAQFLLDECRMVLPGLQALFGFQLIAVVSAEFGQKLGTAEQRVHFAALILSAIAAAIMMTPAAMHRYGGGREVTVRFIRLSTRLLLLSMFPLATSICLDVALIGRVILGPGLGVIAGAALLGVFLGMWLLLPRLSAKP